MKLQSGDVICCSTPFALRKPISWLSSAIRAVTKSNWSHCAIVVSVWDKTFVAEALATGIILRPLDEWPRDCKVDILRSVHPLNEKDFCTRALSKVGHTGYDYGSLLWFQLIYQLTGHWMGHTSASRSTDKKLYCSEFVGWLFPTVFKEWWLMSPSAVQSNHTDFTHVFTGDSRELS